MAEESLRLHTNVQGPVYVDDTCTDCDLCRNIAPEVFKRDDDIGTSVVFEQPTEKDIWGRVYEAIDNCPTESIGISK